MTKQKFYVVWNGQEPGVYQSWDDCREQVEGYPNAKYKSYNSLADAVAAFRGDDAEQEQLILSIATKGSELRGKEPAYLSIPEVNPTALAVDGACSRNPLGPIEYRCVEVSTGKEVFHVGPLPDGTNNVAEYLGLVHTLAYLYNKNDHTTPIYTDSYTAKAWVRNRRHKSSLEHTAANDKIFELLRRADIWLQTHNSGNPILTWNTRAWGEIPADFGRK